MVRREPLNGERFEALIPPVVSAPVFTIRLKASKIFTLAEYVSASIMTEHQREMIESAVLNRRNILVVGGTGTGKTTLTNATFALKNKMNIPCRFSLSVC